LISVPPAFFSWLIAKLPHGIKADTIGKSMRVNMNAPSIDEA
jgi:hypothetical protein